MAPSALRNVVAFWSIQNRLFTVIACMAILASASIAAVYVATESGTT